MVVDYFNNMTICLSHFSVESTGNKKIEHGDIVLDNSRNAMICRRSPKSCLWPSSEDRNVYVPYRLSRDYGKLFLLTFIYFDK